ncbi:25190_t:CDS:2, partial [Gigaspora margarita]
TISEKNLINLKKEMIYFYKIEHVNIDVISILVYKSSLKKNINDINKDITGMNFFTQKEAGNNVKYFRKWQSDLEQYNKAIESLDCRSQFSFESSLEKLRKIANNMKSVFNKEACHFFMILYKYANDKEAIYK